jgi:hypothetical protein
LDVIAHEEIQDLTAALLAEAEVAEEEGGFGSRHQSGITNAF